MGVGGEEPTGWSQLLTSPSPSAPEVGHRCTGRLTTGHTDVVEQLLAAGAAVDAVDNEGQGPWKRPVGTTGGGVEDDLMQSE